MATFSPYILFLLCTSTILSLGSFVSTVSISVFDSRRVSSSFDYSVQLRAAGRLGRLKRDRKSYSFRNSVSLSLQLVICFCLRSLRPLRCNHRQSGHCRRIKRSFFELLKFFYFQFFHVISDADRRSSAKVRGSHKKLFILKLSIPLSSLQFLQCCHFNFFNSNMLVKVQGFLLPFTVIKVTTP